MSIPRYTAVAVLFHWLIAVAIGSNFVLGLVMTDMAMSPAKLKYYSYHKWAGVTIFLLVLLRILWRLFHRPPELPAHMKTWERALAGVSHLLLYAATLAVPLTGWLFSSAKGFKTVYFGKWPIPDLLDKNPLLADLLKEAHENLAFLMAALVVLHVAAALKHHFIDRDDILARMVPGLRPRTGG
ncbi:MAG: cytochrome b [Burkholderiales bacterium]|nr:cytochrome b [Burkholderiales bacterium]